MVKKINQQVLPHPDGWAVKKEGARKVTAVFSTQEEAIARAKEIALRSDSKVIVFHRSGSFRAGSRNASSLLEGEVTPIHLSSSLISRSTNKTALSASYPDPEILEYMEFQAEQFERLRSELVQQYLGKYVLFENGEVLDADEDHAALVIRAYGETGPRPLFVKKVLSEEPQLNVRTPWRIK